MKKNQLYLPLLIIFCLLNTQKSDAQFFKKLKEKLSNKEKTETNQYVSDSAQTFQKWDQGASDIIAYIVSEFDASKRTHIVGNINEDGSFSYKLPDSIGTSIPVSAFAEECTNANDAVLKNPEVKIALAKLWVGQNKEFIGGMDAVNPVEAINNLGKNKENNGEKGDTYLLVYADGEASISINCNKKFVMRNERGQAYKDKVDAESAILLDLNKGWNLLRTRVSESIPSGSSFHFTKNQLTIIDALPNDIKWVYQPTEE